jgi:hypothetical protein
MESRRKFPNEVWLQIFAQLQFRQEPFLRPKILYPSFFRERLALAKIARVSKNFNAMATPLLYHTLPVNSFPFSRFSLARTLIMRPDLAQLVQEADITVENVWDQDLLEALTAALNACSKSMVSFFEFLLDRYRRKECSAADHTAFFLCMLPNLRVAELEVDISSKPMLEILAAWPNSLLPRVEDLRLRGCTVKPTVANRGLEYLIQLPSVRTFHGMGIRWEEYRGPVLGLRRLVLHYSSVGEDGIHNILLHCVRLETLQLHLEGLYMYRIDLSLVGDILRNLGQNLENLDIGSLPETPRGSLGSLCTLNRLKKLTLPWDMVVRTPEVDPSDESAEGQALVLPQGIPRLIDLLPDSLEHLHLYPGEADVENWQLLELVESDRFSRLLSVCVARQKRVNRDDVDQLAFGQDLSRLGWALRKYKEHGWSSEGGRLVL